MRVSMSSFERGLDAEQKWRSTLGSTANLHISSAIESANKRTRLEGPPNGGVSNGGGFPIWTCPSFFVLFCPFWDFPDFSGIFPICSGTLRGFSRFVLFLFLGLLRAPTRNSPERVRDTIWTFPEKSGKHPGLETPRFSFSQTLMHFGLSLRWKVAGDLRFRAAISEPKTASFCGISGDLAPSTRKSLAIAIVRFWCAKDCWNFSTLCGVAIGKVRSKNSDLARDQIGPTRIRSLDGRNFAIVIEESLARAIAAIGIASVATLPACQNGGFGPPARNRKKIGKTRISASPGK